MRRRRRVALLDPLAADLRDEPLDGLGLDVQTGEFGQIAGRLLIRMTVDPRMDDLSLHARAESRVVNAQGLILREKKPSGIEGNWRLVVSGRRFPASS